MPQYSDGIINVENGSTLVSAGWQVYVQGAPFAFRTGGALAFLTSGATGRTISHVVSQNQLDFNLDSGSSDPQASEGVEGPTNTNPDGGTADATSTVNALIDLTKNWSNDLYNGQWVVVDEGGEDEEWRKISDTQGPHTLVPETPFSQEPDGLSYGIYTNQQATLLGFKRGTPQDFVAASVFSGHMLVALDNTPMLIQSNIQARQFELSASWSGGDGVGVAFAIHRDYTPLLGLPVVATGDARPNAMVGRLAYTVDQRFQQARGSKTVVSMGSYMNGWHDPIMYPLTFTQGWYQMLVGCYGSTCKETTPSPPEVMFVLEEPWRPFRITQVILATDAGWARVKFDYTNGQVTLMENYGGGKEIFFDTLHYRGLSAPS